MREFSTTLNNAIMQGLRPRKYIQDDVSYLAEMYNLVPDGTSCRTYEGKESVPGDTEDTWISRMEPTDLLISNNVVHEISKTGVKLDAKTTLPGDNQKWKMITHGDNWFAVSPDACKMFFDSSYYENVDFGINAIIRHKGRTLFAGTPKSWLPADVAELFRQFGVVQYGAGENQNYDFDIYRPNTLWWSSFDSVDFPYGLMDLSLLSNLSDRFTHNQLGWMELSHGEELLELGVVGENVYAFSKNFTVVLRMLPEAAGASYGELVTETFGIAGRFAFAGDASLGLFIDSKGHLRKISSQGITDLDFSEYISKLDYAEVVVSKEVGEDRWFIGDESTSYYLVGSRLTSIYETVQVAENGSRLAISTWDSTYAYLRSERLSLGMATNKTLTGAAFIGTGFKSGEFMSYTHIGDREIISPVVPTNKEGYAAIRIYGQNHEISLFLPREPSSHIERIELKWQIDDRRTTRGVFATEGNTGTGQ